MQGHTRKSRERVKKKNRHDGVFQKAVMIQYGKDIVGDP
jgi:hypothetical protein